jgi:hypothetical protein
VGIKYVGATATYLIICYHFNAITNLLCFQQNSGLCNPKHFMGKLEMTLTKTKRAQKLLLHTFPTLFIDVLPISTQANKIETNLQFKYI